MKMHEEALQFHDQMTGVLTWPARSEFPRPDTCVIFLNSGFLHKAGPHRLWVKIARRLAHYGYASLRVDFSGIGDSAPSSTRTSFADRWVTETVAAVDYAIDSRRFDRVVLAGNCSGAAIAAKVGCEDARVGGVIMMNARGEGIPARHYWRVTLHQRLRQRIWTRLWQRQLSISAIVERLPGLVYGTRRSSSDAFEEMRSEHIGTREPETATHWLKGIEDVWAELSRRNLPILFIYSEPDHGLDHFQMAAKRSNFEIKEVDLEVIKEADHLFSSVRSQEAVQKILKNWLARTLG